MTIANTITEEAKAVATLLETYSLANRAVVHDSYRRGLCNPYLNARDADDSIGILWNM